MKVLPQLVLTALQNTNLTSCVLSRFILFTIQRRQNFLCVLARQRTFEENFSFVRSVLLHGDNAFLGKALSFRATSRLSTFCRSPVIEQPQESAFKKAKKSKNGVYGLLALCHALPLLLGIYRKVSLKLTARVFLKISPFHFIRPR